MVLIHEVQKYKLPVENIEPPSFFTDKEIAEAAGATLLFDCECYSNYFLAAFKDPISNKIIYFERSPNGNFDSNKLRWIMENFLLVGFNCLHYDVPLLWGAVAGFWASELKSISDLIILSNVSISQIEEQFNYKCQRANVVDLQNVAPGVGASLKQYGGRMHVRRLQDLPVDMNKALTEQEATVIKYYCFNDLDLTGSLWKFLEQPLELRKTMSFEYNVDLRSKSDAQIPESVIANEIAVLTGSRPRKPKIEPGTSYQYQPPRYLQFSNQQFQHAFYDVCNSEFSVSDDGKIIMPPNIASMKLKLGKTAYQMGIGGLHSCEKRMTYYSTNENILIDRDVESYYPAIILNNNLFPEHIGDAFTSIFRKIVDRRIAAKKAGNKSVSESLKITINGCFGKLGSKWSCLYSPNLLIQVTLTGQLTLLMLIEQLEWFGIHVVSGNTDGLVIRCPQAKLDIMNDVISRWEQTTGFKTEETRYRSIHARDVNNYIAITQDGGIKAKGIYSTSLSFKDKNREALMKNPNAEILVESLFNFITQNKPILDTIKSCRDIRKFLFVKKVKGGAAKDRVYLGKTIRWYKRFQEYSAIHYVMNGNLVPDSGGGYPLLVLPNEFPKDVDYDWYNKRANQMLVETGYLDARQMSLFGEDN